MSFINKSVAQSSYNPFTGTHIQNSGTSSSFTGFGSSVSTPGQNNSLLGSSSQFSLSQSSTSLGGRPGSLFGQTSQTGQSPFANSNNQLTGASPFSQLGSQQSNVSPFGQLAQTTISPFAQPATQQFTGTFGQPTQQGSLFGQSSTQNSQSPFTQSSGSLFGQTSQTGQSPFSQSNTQQTSPFGQQNLFSSGSNSSQSTTGVTNLLTTQEDLPYEPWMLEAFKADKFENGKIPELPPPLTS